MNTHQKKIKEAAESVNAMREKVSGSHWKPAYHPAPPAYWMNDPNGFSYYKGEYHLFYQHHPYSTEWGPMYWGHFKSSDLANWEEAPLALAPGEDYDQGGCFSGSAIEKEGKLYLMYTGNRWTGPDHDKDLYQVQALAVSEDGITFEKLAENPVIDAAPEGDIHPYHFRDPKVWKKDDLYYCVLGSRTKDHVGQVLLYQSKDMIQWEFLNVAAKGEGNFGYMWECPDLFELNGQTILMMSPQGMKPEGNRYHNLHQAGYVAGQLDYETGTLSHGEFEVLDHGFDFYAPQTMLDPSGRRIMIAWMNMWESHMPEQEEGFAGAMTIPRELVLENGKLKSKPVPELGKRRHNHKYYQNVKVEGETSLTGIEGSAVELKVAIDAKDAGQFGLKLRAGHKQETELLYLKEERSIVLDRSLAGEGPGGVRKAETELQDNVLKLQIFIDHSSVEVFINGGEKVMTARIYPDQSSSGIRFFSDKPIELLEVEKWDL
ncbi:glycoside hydrolase family 32 protein [Bacillus salacetis]|uniref:Sucrose-6-phosphate hydrolase n=1 Tax=Bacillus salacetis TaxID=2315464 RepID=A0A3A1QPW8_9BACI|nr:glycoside hydrolase family 32 protein [Bacillus salacetis]RIW29115.1 glycoside hydrolase family 32 protein [Bacillus salacetis]